MPAASRNTSCTGPVQSCGAIGRSKVSATWRIASGEHGGAPGSIVMLSGDVHHAYLAQVAFRDSVGWHVREGVWARDSASFEHVTLGDLYGPGRRNSGGLDLSIARVRDGLTAAIAVSYASREETRIGLIIDRDLRYSFAEETPW